MGEHSWSDKSIVAIDTIGAREGDIVIWISAREATLAVTERVVPTDAAIIGIVD
jgi:microcompartment protein CcmK/EutM